MEGKFHLCLMRVKQSVEVIQFVWGWGGPATVWENNYLREPDNLMKVTVLPEKNTQFQLHHPGLPCRWKGLTTAYISTLWNFGLTYPNQQTLRAHPPKSMGLSILSGSCPNLSGRERHLRLPHSPAY
jgi:hypothetical protein